MPECFDDKSDNAEEFGVRPWNDGREGRVFWQKPYLALLFLQPFDGESPFNGRDDDVPVARREAAVDNEDIAVINTSASHALPANADKVGSGRVPYAEGIEIKCAMQSAIRWAGEAGSNTFRKEGRQGRIRLVHQLRGVGR